MFKLGGITMTISQKSFYHGAALIEITRHKSFTSMNLAPHSTSSSAYQVNHDIGIYIKHTTKTNQDSWRFTFTPSHQKELLQLRKRYDNKTHIILVCDDIGICSVTYDIFFSCIDLSNTDQEWFEVYRYQGGSFRVRGALGEYEKTIPISKFPASLFEK